MKFLKVLELAARKLCLVPASFQLYSFASEAKLSRLECQALMSDLKSSSVEETKQTEIGAEEHLTKAVTTERVKRKVAMVAHFVCLLYTAFIVYTAQPGTSKLDLTFFILVSQVNLIEKRFSCMLQVQSFKFRRNS